MPLRTVVVPGADTVHVWETGTQSTLCGAGIEDMPSAGSASPSGSGQICQPCQWEHRVLVSRQLWAEIEPYFDAEPNPHTPVREPRQARIGPGLKHLWDAGSAD